MKAMAPAVATLLCLHPGVMWGQDAARRTESPVQRGSVQIAGTASFTHSRDRGTDFEWTTLDVVPTAAYFVTRGLAVGVNARHRSIWYDHQATVRNQKFSEWGAGPRVTYYMSTKSPRLFPFVSARTMFSRGLNKADIYESPQSDEPTLEGREERTKTRSWLLGGGVLYMVVKHVGITGEGFYQRTTATVAVDKPDESSNSAEIFGLQWGIAAFIF